VCYRPGVTEQPILADRIRELAAEAGYDVIAHPGLEVPLEVRQAIKRELGLKTIQNVNNALKADPNRQGQGGGRPIDPHVERCPACQQAIRNEAARLALQQFLTRKRRA